jgi:hypothetical protein
MVETPAEAYFEHHSKCIQEDVTLSAWTSPTVKRARTSKSTLALLAQGGSLLF